MCLKAIKRHSLCSESGRLFHTRGAETAKARSPSVERRVHGTTSCEVDEDLSLCFDSREATGWTRSDRYCGAEPLRHQYVRTHSLYWMRSGTRSQMSPSAVASRGQLVILASAGSETCCIIDVMKSLQVRLRQTCQSNVAVVDFRHNK